MKKYITWDNLQWLGNHLWIIIIVCSYFLSIEEIKTSTEHLSTLMTGWFFIWLSTKF